MIYETCHTSTISRSKIYISAYHGKPLKWRRLQFPWRSTVWQIKHEADTNVSKYLMTFGLERRNTDRQRGLFGAPEACQFRHCQALGGVFPKILEWRWRRRCQDRTSRWDITFFVVVVKQNGGCYDTHVRVYGKMREAECALTWKCEVWRGLRRRKAFCSRWVWRSFLEQYARAVAHFYKTRSLIVYSKKYLDRCISRDNVYYVLYIAMQTQIYIVVKYTIELVISVNKILYCLDICASYSRYYKRDKIVGNEFANKIKSTINFPELSLFHLGGNFRNLHDDTSPWYTAHLHIFMMIFFTLSLSHAISFIDHKYSAVVVILDLSIYAFCLSVCLVECESCRGKTFRTTSEEKWKTERSISLGRLTRWKLLLSKTSRGEWVTTRNGASRCRGHQRRNA